LDSKGTAFFGRGSVKETFPFSETSLSQALRKASYSDIKKQQIKERLQGASAA